MTYQVAGGAAQPTVIRLPDTAVEVTVGFYTVGIELSEARAKHRMVQVFRLLADIVKAFGTHALDVLCLNDLGELDADVVEWFSELLKTSAAPPVLIFCDSHYATLVVPDRIRGYSYNWIQVAGRTFQHLRIHVEGIEAPTSIINFNIAAAPRRKMSSTERLQYFRACREACHNDRFIWGGCNIGLIQLLVLLQSFGPRFSDGPNGSLRVVYSHPTKGRQGDFAVTYDFFAVQVNSQVGVNFGGVSDDHDLVIAKVFSPTNGMHVAPGSAAQLVPMLLSLTPPAVTPQRQTSPEVVSDASDSDAALPADHASLMLKVVSPPMDKNSEHETGEAAGNAAQLVAKRHRTVKSPTPRVDEILGSNAENTASLRDLLKRFVIEWATRSWRIWATKA